MPHTTPFTDPATVTELYARADRLHRRTAALHQAKISGEDATATIATIAAAAQPAPHRILDIGCGRGTLTARLARQYPTTTLVAVDQSPALLDLVQRRLTVIGHHAHVVPADFHQLPLPDRYADLIVASFCLYHSARPEAAVAELARCLRPGGHLIATTKSDDSYRTLNTLLAATGIDPHAPTRPSLYRTFHTGNAAAILTAGGLTVNKRIDQEHTFRFRDLAHVAAYTATCPQFQLPPGLHSAPQRLAATLRHRTPDAPVTATSTVTYLLATRP